MSDWMLPFGDEEKKSLTPGIDASMGESLTREPLTPLLDSSMTGTRFGIGSQLGTENSIGERWQLPMKGERRNQSLIDKLAAKKQRSDIITGQTMALGIGELLKSDEFKNYLGKLTPEE